MYQREQRLRVDLHIHSTASDGTWSPEELVDQVACSGIEFFSVTDHDTVSSVHAAGALAAERGLAFVPGVEVSSKLDGRLFHILAYGIDANDRTFGRFLAANETRLRQHDDVTVRMLIAAGYDIDQDEYERYTWQRSRGGWKALNFLIDQGFCRDVWSFFSELFIGDLELGCPDFPHPAEVVEAIRQAGAAPVWAHPGASLRKAPKDDQTAALQCMLDAGVQGIECFSCQNDDSWTERCVGWARRHRLLITGGSDSHGGFAGRELGIPHIYLRDLTLGVIAERVQHPVGLRYPPSTG